MTTVQRLSLTPEQRAEVEALLPLPPLPRPATRPTFLKRLALRVARKQASDRELARVLGISIAQLDADTTAPDPQEAVTR